MNRRGWVGFALDAGLGVVFAAALAFQAYRIADSWGGAYWQFGCGAGAVVCGLALVRRRGRLWVAIAGLAVAAVAIVVARLAGLPSEPGPAMALGLSVLVGSGVRVLPAWSAGAVAAGGGVVVAGGLLAAFVFSTGSVVAVLNGVAWVAGLVAGLGPRLLAARRRAITERVRRNERLELARELHDVVADHITSIVLQAQAGQLLARKQPHTAEGSLADIEAAGSDALAATRRVVGLLRDANADAVANTDDTYSAASGPTLGAAGASAATPGAEQLGELVKRFDGHGLVVRLSLPDGESGWPSEVARTLYRIVQESLTNISRHAPNARHVTVSVARDRDAVRVQVVDDAPPGAAHYPHRGGYGLIGMRERVEALGGTLSVGPRQGAGWSVLATLPISTPASVSRRR
ncbi:sensor histidine kinase [Nonomuraea aurantiaca]|uniref:sensor histidine kinase n=1 Tax=Nonomuraea aurantiaca TaxID=2878562 RepID=UPI001CD9A8AC|nr:sensor histidine kinase [Nonomuraea aurantiaca]MCA2225411.1 sensor histidine kinase [Nonomuraea aurantiaca]